MNCAITRRDFLGGVGVAVASSVLPASARADATATYPPALTALRGSHPGSFEIAHQMAFAKRVDWGTATEPDDVVYDLVVVGAGVSGLAAAFFYREQHRAARILLVDNHDDFGGHAKRNEFRIGDQTLLGYWGQPITRKSFRLQQRCEKPGSGPYPRSLRTTRGASRSSTVRGRT